MMLTGDSHSPDYGCQQTPRARVAELADALVLGTSGVTRESSSLSFRTTSPGDNILNNYQ